MARIFYSWHFKCIFFSEEFSIFSLLVRVQSIGNKAALVQVMACRQYEDKQATTWTNYDLPTDTYMQLPALIW